MMHTKDSKQKLKQAETVKIFIEEGTGKQFLMFRNKPAQAVFSLAQTAHQLGIGTTSVKRLKDEGKIGHVRLSNGRIGITQQQIDEYLSRNTKEPFDAEADAERLMQGNR